MSTREAEVKPRLILTGKWVKVRLDRGVNFFSFCSRSCLSSIPSKRACSKRTVIRWTLLELFWDQPLAAVKSVISKQESFTFFQKVISSHRQTYRLLRQPDLAGLHLWWSSGRRNKHGNISSESSLCWDPLGLLLIQLFLWHIVCLGSWDSQNMFDTCNPQSSE